MPTITDYLLKAGASIIQPNVFVRFVNNLTARAYVSSAITDANGMYTIPNLPTGAYTVFTGPTAGGPWTPTGNVNYQVAPTKLGHVNPADYGAQFDGVTDDTTAWLNALTDLVTFAPGGGGEIDHPGGVSIAAGLTWDSNVHLRAAGFGASILKLKSNSNTFLIQSRNFATLTGTNSSAGIFNYGFHDITFDGNKAANATAPDLIQLYGYGQSITDVRERNGNARGLYSEWSNMGASPGNDSMEGVVTNSKFHDNGTAGIVWAGPHDTVWTNVISYNNNTSGLTGTNPNGSGIWIKANGGGHFTTCHVWGISHTYGWYLEDTCNLHNSEGEGAMTANCMIGKNDCVLTGGSYFGGAAGLVASIQIGDATHAGVGGVDIHTKVVSPPTGAVAVQFNNGELANRVRVLVFQAAGNAVGGSPNITDLVEILVSGGATGLQSQYPNDTIVGSKQTNYWWIKGATTGNPIEMDATGGDANIGIKFIVKGTGGYFFGSTQANSFQLQPAGTGANPAIIALGSDANIALLLWGKGTGGIALAQQLANYVLVSGAATGFQAQVAAAGTDANVGLRIVGQGTGAVFIGSNFTNYFQISGSAATAPLNIAAIGGDANIGLQIQGKGTGGVVIGTNFANNLQLLGAAAASPVNIAAIGSDTNINLQLQPKGTGVVDFVYAAIALGGGATATLGTIGGSGPAAAAQNAWLKANINSVASYIPFWR